MSRRATRKKKKLGLSDFTKCHPGKRPTANGRCLPGKVYASIARSTQGGRSSGSKGAVNGVVNGAVNGSTTASQESVYTAVGCKDGEDHCLLDKAPLPDQEKKDLRKAYLRPKKPKAWDSDPDLWLDNVNIQDIMKQYEEACPWFRFLGVFPIDFSAPDPYQKNHTASPQCLYKETCNLDLKKEYQKGIRGIGMIFNLDPHFKGGSHWVALYINLQNIKKPIVSYFDSYGYKTPEMIARLMKSFLLQIETCELGYNARRFQYGGSECGMFSLYFLICMIHGIPFADFCKDAIHDEMMLNLRQILFQK